MILKLKQYQSTMKIISWNVSGNGYYSLIKDLISKYKPIILTLMETKVNSIRTSKI